MRARITVRLKKGLLNPEAKTIQRSLELLGYKNISGFDTERVFLIDLDVESAEKARREVEEMCRRILVNPVIEEYTIHIE